MLCENQSSWKMPKSPWLPFRTFTFGALFVALVLMHTDRAIADSDSCPGVSASDWDAWFSDLQLVGDGVLPEESFAPKGYCPSDATLNSVVSVRRTEPYDVRALVTISLPKEENSAETVGHVKVSIFEVDGFLNFEQRLTLVGKYVRGVVLLGQPADYLTIWTVSDGVAVKVIDIETGHLSAQVFFRMAFDQERNKTIVWPWFPVEVQNSAALYQAALISTAFSNPNLKDISKEELLPLSRNLQNNVEVVLSNINLAKCRIDRRDYSPRVLRESWDFKIETDNEGEPVALQVGAWPPEIDKSEFRLLVNDFGHRVSTCWPSDKASPNSTYWLKFTRGIVVRN